MYDKSALMSWFDTYVVPNDFLGIKHNLGYGGVEFYYEVDVIVDVLTGRKASEDIPAAPVPGISRMQFESYCDADGVVEGFNMYVVAEEVIEDRELVLGTPVKYLTRALDGKELTDDIDAVGVESAWAVVTALADAWIDLYQAEDRLRSALDLLVEFRGMLSSLTIRAKQPQ